MLAARLARENVRNVTLVPGAIDDPKLPASSIDLVLMVDVYHEFSEPQKMLRGIRTALKPDGRLVLLEYRKEDPDVPIRLRTQNVGRRSEAGARGRRVYPGQSRRSPAAATHPDLLEIALLVPKRNSPRVGVRPTPAGHWTHTSHFKSICYGHFQEGLPCEACELRPHRPR